ncbi:MAG: hypothetical protein HQK50_08310 [Oligoflexia bacterium]|nr:hypothetical protein [Oligoflexia bacterium]MBF0365561.1 hypothetical protein [Oligoflexia bacterium]
MKMFLLKNYQLLQDFRKVLLLFFFQVGLFALSLVVEWILKQLSFGEVVIKLLFGAIFFQLLYKSLMGLYYTYWSLLGLFVVYASTGLWQYLVTAPAINWQLVQIFSLILAVTWIQGYILSSPIFYPRVRWWVYDFRYRGDLVVKVRPYQEKAGMDHTPELMLNGRLTDLRRGAGCVLLFERLQIRDKIFIYAESRYSEVRLLAEVISVREYSFGRGHIHGVKFIFEDHEDRKVYREFASYWKEEVRAKIEMEYEEGQANVEYYDVSKEKNGKDGDDGENRAA